MTYLPNRKKKLIIFIFRFDPPYNYSSYLYSRGRARAPESFYLHLITKDEEEKTLTDLATYDAFGKV